MPWAAYAPLPPYPGYVSPSAVGVYHRSGVSPLSPNLRAKDQRYFSTMTQVEPYLFDVPYAVRDDWSYGADPAAAAPGKTKPRPFKAVSEFFRPGAAEQAIQKVQRGVGELKRQVEEITKPAPTPVVQVAAPRAGWSGGEMAIVAGVGLAGLGLGVWIGRQMRG